MVWCQRAADSLLLVGFFWLRHPTAPFRLKSWNINAYVAIQNILNTKNVFYENYRSDGTKETVYQFAFFPVVGVEIEY